MNKFIFPKRPSLVDVVFRIRRWCRSKYGSNIQTCRRFDLPSVWWCLVRVVVVQSWITSKTWIDIWLIYQFSLFMYFSLPTVLTCIYIYVIAYLCVYLSFLKYSYIYFTPNLLKVVSKASHVKLGGTLNGSPWQLPTFKTEGLNQI